VVETVSVPVFVSGDYQRKGREWARTSENHGRSFGLDVGTLETIAGIHLPLGMELSLLVDDRRKHRWPLEPVFELDLGGVEGLHRLGSVALYTPEELRDLLDRAERDQTEELDHSWKLALDPQEKKELLHVQDVVGDLIPVSHLAYWVCGMEVHTWPFSSIS
jgi:hypothetical protein